MRTWGGTIIGWVPRAPSGGRERGHAGRDRDRGTRTLGQLHPPLGQTHTVLHSPSGHPGRARDTGMNTQAWG